MRSLFTFVGGVAVGILTVTGVYAMDEEESPSCIDCEDELELELEEMSEDEKANDGNTVLVRTS